MRTTLRYVRDVIWADLDGTIEDGFRPEHIQVHLTGESAGGFGDAANYHYVVDELRWSDATLAPVGALSLDGGLISVADVAELERTDWALDRVMPPYCRQDRCATGPAIQL